MSEQSKCPVTGAGTPVKFCFQLDKGTSNRDWWPNSLNLKILSQHSSLVILWIKNSIMQKNSLKKLNLDALKKDLS